eukprot:CAMPEP_0119069594 /NCGR_PEP_ID=MMETSP1178-20130426/24327_1 /TAXON_ID=33656 /ORGANISM="unid sp, Strain CCMP2000" /LENGTH=119 /DNA_ID=CAMNT_0007051371 /DNA_START=29 /DNA_END=388 /DNA_ORIENTATION=-
MAVRTLCLVLCALAQSHALVVSPHTGALIRSGVSTPTQQLCSAPADASRVADIVMAVPKKRQSKMKTRQRKANWFAKARRQAQLAYNRAASIKYDPFEDPKFSTTDDDDDDDDDDEDDE